MESVGLENSGPKCRAGKDMIRRNAVSGEKPSGNDDFSSSLVVFSSRAIVPLCVFRGRIVEEATECRGTKKYN